VIAIIGILSSVVLASLNTARSKANDAKVKAQLAGLRAAAEVYYDTHGDYGTAASSDCADVDFFADVDSGMVQYTNQDNYPAGATLSCQTDMVSYAVSALLLSSTTAAWCVDSTGLSMEISGNLGAGEVTCP